MIKKKKKVFQKCFLMFTKNFFLEKFAFDSKKGDFQKRVFTKKKKKKKVFMNPCAT